MRKTRFLKFTLVEMLVVIAVISVLMTLLLPALSSAKAKGQQISCIGNMRQTGMGMMSYTQESNDWLVEYYTTTYGAGNLWRNILKRNGYLGNGKILICPVEADNLVTWGVPTNYGYNKKCGLYQWYSSPGYQPLRLSSISKPSICVILIDGQPVATDYYDGFDDFPSWGKKRHNKGMDILLVDGHAVWCNPPNDTQACGYWWGRPK